MSLITISQQQWQDWVQWVGARLIIPGSGAPAAGLGLAGQVYIDVTTGEMYGPKTDSGWGSGQVIVPAPEIAFADLTDGFDLAGQGGKLVGVKSDASGLEAVEAAGGGNPSAALASFVDVSNTTETSLVKLEFAAGTLKKGTTLRFRCMGNGTANSNGLVHWQFRIGTATLSGTVVHDACNTTSENADGSQWSIEEYVTVQESAGVYSAVGFVDAKASAFFQWGSWEGSPAFPVTITPETATMAEMTFKIDASSGTSAQIRIATAEIVVP